ncbi:MAG: aldo/keto reductase [Clostridiales bacterium]|nr:aldo/keto reductase [Clostridiales bacterium]
MNKRKLTNTNIEVSTLGFGAMRLPLLDAKDNSSIDEKKATKMIRYAIDNGVNYIDTAYPYHGGKSEIFIGKVLKDGYREKVYLTSKLPCWNLKNKDEFLKIFTEQLNKLDVKYLDTYLLHAMNKKSWENVNDLGVLDFLDNLKEQGKIKQAGFSFHDDYEVFTKIIDSYNWDVCQIQFNYFDSEAEDMLNYATDKGVDVIVMEPLRGGALVNDLPEEIIALFNNATIKRSPAEWGFRWVYNHEKVKLILSGMSTMEQVIENLNTFNYATANSMTQEEKHMMEEVTQVFKDKILVPCTSCQYCMPCPYGVNIPLMFKTYNNYSMFGKSDKYKNQYQEWARKEENRFTADVCVGCRVCEDKCPQNIIISERMIDVDRELG